MLFGGPTLYALRQSSESAKFRYVGDCAIDGMMDGGRVEKDKSGEEDGIEYNIL